VWRATEKGRSEVTDRDPLRGTDWYSHLSPEFEEPYWAELHDSLDAEQPNVYPSREDIYAALELTSCADTKVVILGQEQYHGAAQAHGLCFSVPPDVAIPPSLMNIHKELCEDVGIEPPGHGSLVPWTRQGVLLLNAALTVAAGKAGSHRRRWETFTDRIIEALSGKPDRVVFILWGREAQQKKKLIDARRHTIIETSHPSPISARRYAPVPFLGSRPFSMANSALAAADKEPVNWALGDGA
jgi:uracil-DNA glycosylase